MCTCGCCRWSSIWKLWLELPGACAHIGQLHLQVALLALNRSAEVEVSEVPATSSSVAVAITSRDKDAVRDLVCLTAHNLCGAYAELAVSVHCDQERS